MFRFMLSVQHFTMEYSVIKVLKHTRMIKDKSDYSESNKMLYGSKILQKESLCLILTEDS